MDNSYKYLEKLFLNSYNIGNLKNISKQDFMSNITQRLDNIDYKMEGYIDPGKQRDLSIKFHWGHNHFFDETLNLKGRMEDRHLRIVSKFIDDFGLPRDLSGKKILDIGVWTGGTSLLFVAMGASVVSLEEVRKYSETVNFLADSFGISDRLKCFPESLYNYLPNISEEFDYIIYSGVIYHVTDPLVSLRLIFSSLKNQGEMFLETYGINSSDSVCSYEGPTYFGYGSASDLNRGGWNYFIPSQLCLKNWCQDVGFENVAVSKLEDKRLFCNCKRKEYKDICRAGLSVTDIR